MPEFGEAMLACHAALYRYARALCHDPERAADLVQETFGRGLAAKRKPDPLREDEVRAWLFTILRHLWQNDVRAHAHEEEQYGAALADAATGPTQEAAVMRRLLQSEVRHAIDTLPEAYREVVLLREIEDLSYAEIARIVQCPVGTVMSRLARARALLRHSLVRLAGPARELKR
jgi:RNA polymerase sigma-70 factor (ECF subfamily)